MTRQEEARDKLKYWNLIDRANKIGFNIPQHWLKYGYPPKPMEIFRVCIDTIDVEEIFNCDSIFYKLISHK